MAQAKTATLAPRLDTELARRLVYQMALIRRFGLKKTPFPPVSIKICRRSGVEIRMASP